MSGQSIRRKGSQWEVRYSKGSGKNRVRMQDTFPTRKECQNWLKELALKYENGSLMRRQMLLCDYFSYWFQFEKAKSMGLTPNTIDTYRTTANHLSKVLPNIKVVDADRPLIQSAFNALGRTLSHATLMKDLSHLKSMFRSAVRNKDVLSNPCEDIHIIGNNHREKTYEKKYMSVEDFRLIQNHLIETDYSIRNINQFVLFICSQAALRCGEALALTKNDIDISKRILYIRHSYDSVHNLLKEPKTQSSIREIPLSESATNVIAKWIQNHDKWLNQQGIKNPSYSIMLNRNGVLPKANSINATFKLLQNRLGLPGLYSVHSFRSTIASLMIDKNVPISYVSKYLGHTASSQVTRKYYVDVLPSSISKNETLALSIIADDKK